MDNIVIFKHKLSALLHRKLADLYFKLIQRPFYSLCYNGNGNEFECKGLLRKCKIEMTGGGGNSLQIGENVILNHVTIAISGHHNKLVLHNGVRFSEGGRIRIEDEGNIVEVGENSVLINCFLSSADKHTRLLIGKDCLFSANVVIRTSDSHTIFDSQGKRINDGRDVVIGDHVWIGNGATILKGSVIGDNSVVGTGCVVSGQSVESNSVVVGIPSRVVKRGIGWTVQRI